MKYQSASDIVPSKVATLLPVLANRGPEAMNFTSTFNRENLSLSLVENMNRTMSDLSLRARFSYLLIVINSWFKSAVITLKSSICSNSRDCMTLVFLIEVNTGVYLHSGDILINLGNAICRSSSPSSYA